MGTGTAADVGMPLLGAASLVSVVLVAEMLPVTALGPPNGSAELVVGAAAEPVAAGWGFAAAAPFAAVGAAVVAAPAEPPEVLNGPAAPAVVAVLAAPAAGVARLPKLKFAGPAGAALGATAAALLAGAAPNKKPALGALDGLAWSD